MLAKRPSQELRIEYTANIHRLLGSRMLDFEFAISEEKSQVANSLLCSDLLTESKQVWLVGTCSLLFQCFFILSSMHTETFRIINLLLATGGYACLLTKTTFTKDSSIRFNCSNRSLHESLSSRPQLLPQRLPSRCC
jgi:hypothetical protein